MVFNLAVERLKLLVTHHISNSRPLTMVKFVVERFTIKVIFDDAVCPIYFGLQQSERHTLSCKQKPRNTAHLLMSDSFTVVGHVARRVISFQVVEYGHLTEHVNAIT